MTAPIIGTLFKETLTMPLSTNGVRMPLCERLFYLTNSTTPAPVYANATLTTPLAQPVIANANGRFPAIYLNPQYQYRSQLSNAAGQLLEDIDPINLNNAFVTKAAFKTATTAAANNVPAIDPDLQVSLPSAGSYRVELDLVFTAGAAGATPGVVIQLQTTGTPNIVSGNALALYGSLNSAAPTISLRIASASTASLGTSATSNTVRASGVIQLLAGGVLALYWSQNNFSVNLTSLLAGSSMVVTQIA